VPKSESYPSQNRMLQFKCDLHHHSQQLRHNLRPRFRSLGRRDRAEENSAEGMRSCWRLTSVFWKCGWRIRQIRQDSRARVSIQMISPARGDFTLNYEITGISVPIMLSAQAAADIAGLPPAPPTSPPPKTSPPPQPATHPLRSPSPLQTTAKTAGQATAAMGLEKRSLIQCLVLQYLSGEVIETCLVSDRPKLFPFK
jgi:hypothetical protein